MSFILKLLNMVRCSAYCRFYFAHTRSSDLYDADLALILSLSLPFVLSLAKDKAEKRLYITASFAKLRTSGE